MLTLRSFFGQIRFGDVLWKKAVPVIWLDLTISNQKGTPARNPSAELKLEEGAKTSGGAGREE